MWTVVIHQFIPRDQRVWLEPAFVSREFAAKLQQNLQMRVDCQVHGALHVQNTGRYLNPIEADCKLLIGKNRLDKMPRSLYGIHQEARVQRCSIRALSTTIRKFPCPQLTPSGGACLMPTVSTKTQEACYRKAVHTFAARFWRQTS